MSDMSTISVDFHVKRYSDFDLLRIARAVGQGYEGEVTAFLVNVQIQAGGAVWVVFGHTRQGPYGQYSDGHLIQISDIHRIQKEGRFWIITTVGSRYVVATFKRDGGRGSLREFKRLASAKYAPSPNRLH